MGVESADGSGPRVGRVATRETNCPDGHQQRLGHPLGFRERNVGELELRVLLGPGDHGVCHVIVEEREEEVYVRVLVHCAPDYMSARRDHRCVDCPVRVELDGPLGERAVIDYDNDEELPLHKPLYMNDHGYYRVARRRPACASSREDTNEHASDDRA
jgi:hypothetical protein